MRSSIQCCAALVLGLSASSSALACDPVATTCPPALTVYPAFTPEGIRVGTIVMRVRPPLALERSRFTGQPLTVVYNDPGRVPGSVDPVWEIVPLPHVAHRDRTRAVFAHGY